MFNNARKRHETEITELGHSDHYFFLQCGGAANAGVLWVKTAQKQEKAAASFMVSTARYSLY